MTQNEIQAGIGEGFLQRIFGGKSFMHCLVELVKNCRDWGATSIRLDTSDRTRLVIVDNGCGMNRANRNAFLSINMTTASDDQSGTFCTGTKQTLFSQAEQVTVLTAPEEEPGYVYRFRFTTAEYEALALKRGKLTPERMKKNSESWPYNFDFGTEIVYELRNPTRRSVKRGDALAKELSARLPLKFQDVVLVDGRTLPPKELIGEIFTYAEEHPHLGRVSIEIYRPQRKRAEEDLRVTGAEIGEAPISNLHRVLAEFRSDFPPVLLLSEVCGTVSVDFLRDYAMEDRFTINATVADDPRTPHLVRLLKAIEPDVRHRLKIRMGGASDGFKEELDAVKTLFNGVYNPGNEGPSHGSRSGTGGGHGGSKDTPKPIRLQIAKEFEPGETIEVTAHLNKSTGKAPNDLQWLTARSRARDLVRTPTGIRMTADRLGVGTVTADLPGTTHKRTASYEIVAARSFKLSMPHVTIPVGTELRIYAVNVDKLRGELGWSLMGAGEIDEDEGCVVYRASHAGSAVITGFDKSDVGTRATCEVTVVGRLDTLCIRGEHFICDYYEADEIADYAKPATMRRDSEQAHRLVYNVSAPGFKFAMERGQLTSFLALAVAQEFARYHAMELDPTMQIDEIDPRDVRLLFQQIQNQGFAIYEEVVNGRAG